MPTDNSKVVFAIGLPKQALQDMLVTCFEGVCTSWFKGARIGRRPPPDAKPMMLDLADAWNTYSVPFAGGSIIIQHEEILHGAPSETEVDLATMTKALEKMSSLAPERLAKILVMHGGVDADVADTWLQFTVFGEEVFG